MNASLTRQDLETFRDSLRGILGLHFDDSRLEEIAAALRQRLSATRSDVLSYLRRLGGQEDRAEVGALAELLTVCETYFLRHAEQFRALTEVVIPERVRSRSGQRTLRLLSAGCSSGEEAYSIAMVLRESFPDVLETWDVRVTGIDVNPARLEHARAGRFGPWSLREVPESVRRRWFRPSGRELVLDDRIRRAVRFEERNLLEEDPAFWLEGAYDVVFFRNVGMYFPPDVMRAVISRIARALATGGYLFLGHAENLRAISQDFQLRHSHDCFYYQRRGPDEAEDEAEGVAPARRQPAPGVAPTRVDVLAADAIAPVVDPDSSWVDAIQRASERIAALESAAPARPAALVSPAGRKGPSPRSGWDLATAIELMQQERIAEAMEALPPQESADSDAQLLRAVLLTSCGRLAEAESVCSRLLQHDDLNAGAHYVAALCREHAGDRQGAGEHDRTAAYLDPTFAMPRLHLGFLAKFAGNPEAARHELQHAEILLEREDASRILLFGGGFRREALLQLCRAELRACGAPR